MRIRKNKTITPAARIQAANERAGFALTVFEAAAFELDNAADDLLAIENDLLDEAFVKREAARALLAEATATEVQAGVTFERAESVREQAETIRGLVGITAGPQA